MNDVKMKEGIKEKIFTRKDKYTSVGDYLVDKTGSLLDIGSRDKILLSKIDNLLIKYKSADIEGNHDYIMNLEGPLQLEDRAFDYVVALDVLEHVGNIHQAFDELLRVTEQTFIMALPNMASYIHRFSYLFKGKLATDKYALWRTNQGDRHRWLTIQDDIIQFVEGRIKNTSFIVEKMVIEYEGNSFTSRLMKLFFKIGLVSESFMSKRVIFFLSRKIN